MHRVARGFLIFVSVVNGLAGLICGVLLLLEPDGSLMQMGVLLPDIQTFPLADIFFQDFWWIGIAMLLVLGIPNTMAAVLLLRRSERQYQATLVAGVLLILWCGFELIYLFNIAVVAYLAVGVMSILASALLLRPKGAVGAEQPHGTEAGRASLD
jgi:hypothetical protein